MGLPVEVNNLMLGSLGGYTVGRSLRFRSSASAYLNRTPSSTGNRKTFTWSCWVKRGSLSSNYNLFSTWSGGGGATGYIRFNPDDTLDVFDYTGSAYTWRVNTTQVFRDPSAWYHLVIAVDTTQATSTNRVKIYVNGVQVSVFGTYTAPTQNADTYFNAAQLTYIGAVSTGSPSQYFDGYLAEVNFIDGQALTPSSFGAYDTNGVWQPKKYSGTYGTNGFYLPFSNTTSTTTLVQDASGNGNNWTANNISLTAGTTYDSMIDSPTNYADGGNGRGNYCVVNPLDAPTSGSFTITDGNLRTESTSAANRNHVRASFGMTSGKWYWEITSISGDRCQTGIALATSNKNDFVGFDANGWGVYQLDGTKYNNNSSIAYGSAWTTNDIIMHAFDADNGKLFFGKNGTWFASGDPAAGTNAAYTGLTNGPYFAAVGDGSGGGVYAAATNFGQRPFSYTPPTGFKALNTQNLPAASISNGAQYMAATLYTGTGSTQTITNGGNNTIGTTFQPDLIWGKQRNGTSSNVLTDSVRGTNSQLSSNLTNAQDTQTDVVTAFNSNGFTVGASAGFNMNQSGSTLVAWQWKKGAPQGFDIITYTGNGSSVSASHSLGVAPDMVIIKSRSNAQNWVVYHKSLGTSYYVQLNTTSGQINYGGFINPLSSQIYFGGLSDINTNGATYVAYCFAAVRGYSAFGSYNGTGSSDGAFVFTGFRPRYVMVKSTNTAESWAIWDSSRGPYNVILPALFAQSSNGDSASTQIDFLSNGFKLRNSVDNGNISGTTYIYMAFAETPFNLSRAR